MKELILIRHGRTDANDRRLYCGASDLPLSPSGREALEKLQKEREYPDVTGYSVFTSGMLRTEETLEILYGPVEHRVLPELREVDFGAFELRGYEELKDDPAFQRWCEGDNEKNVPPGGESGEGMTLRVIRALADLLEEYDRLLIVGHGGPIAAMMDRLFPAEGKNRWQWQPRNGEGYHVVLCDSPRWEIIPKGDAADG